jgi:MFS family permease
MVEDRKALGNAIALNSLRFNLARVLGPMLAGLVLVHTGVAACFFLNGLSFIAVIISLLMMRLPTFVPASGRAPIGEGLRYIRQNRGVLRIILLIGVSSLMTWPISTLFPVFADYFHRSARGYSAIMSANGFGAAIGGFWLAGLGARFERSLLVYGGSALFCLSLLLLALATSFWLALCLIALGGFAMILFGISAQTRVQEQVPDALRGRVLAVYTLVFNGFFSLGGIEIGALAQRLHAQGAIALNGLLCLIVTACLYAWSVTDAKVQKALSTKDTKEHEGNTHGRP